MSSSVEDRKPSQEPPEAISEVPGELLVSVVTAAFNEENNIPELYRQVSTVLQVVTPNWELIIIDDHSTDDTFEVVRGIASKDPRVKGLRLARNRGSHMAKLAGFEFARGRCGVGLAADLQDPPDVIPRLIEKWREGNQIVWATRMARPSESLATRLFSRLNRFLVGRVLRIKEIKVETSSLLLLDARVLRSLRRFSEQDPHCYGLLRSMGFKTAEVPFVQQARLHGKSKWTFRAKLGLVLRSVLSFSPVPVRIIGLLGWVLVLAAGVTAILGSLYLSTLIGWLAVVVAVLFVGGLHLVALSWIGEYLWKTLEEARARPRYIVEASVGFDPSNLP